MEFDASLAYWVQSVRDLIVLMTGFLVAAAILFAGMALYVRFTPYHEIDLMRAGNVAAGVAYMGATLSMCLPLAAAISSTASLVGLLFWGISAVAIQLLVFAVLARIYRNLPARIEAGEVASALKLATIHVAVGILNAASVSG